MCLSPLKKTSGWHSFSVKNLFHLKIYFLRAHVTFDHQSFNSAVGLQTRYSLVIPVFPLPKTIWERASVVQPKEGSHAHLSGRAGLASLVQSSAKDSPVETDVKHSGLRPWRALPV